MPEDIIPPTPPTTPTPPESKSEMVARADHERAISDMLKHKNEAATLRAEIEAQKTMKLKAENQWQALAEAKEKEVETLKTETKRMNDAIIERERTSALKMKAAALGLRPEAVSDLESLDLTALRIETTNTGKINVLGVSEFADRLKSVKPHWFTDKTPPNVNTTSPRILESGGAITPQDLIAAEREGRKTKDLTKYRELHTKYQQQRSVRG